MAELQSLATAAQQLAAPTTPDIYRKKLDQLESQLADLTRQRLDYLERLHQQQLEVQV